VTAEQDARVAEKAAALDKRLRQMEAGTDTPASVPPKSKAKGKR
jgi:hypothetical protein